MGARGTDSTAHRTGGDSHSPGAARSDPPGLLCPRDGPMQYSPEWHRAAQWRIDALLAEAAQRRRVSEAIARRRDASRPGVGSAVSAMRENVGSLLGQCRVYVMAALSRVLTARRLGSHAAARGAHDVVTKWEFMERLVAGSARYISTRWSTTSAHHPRPGGSGARCRGHPRPTTFTQ